MQGNWLRLHMLKFFYYYFPNCFKLHNQYYHTYKENEINDDEETPQENDDQAENETE